MSDANCGRPTSSRCSPGFCKARAEGGIPFIGPEVGYRPSHPLPGQPAHGTAAMDGPQARETAVKRDRKIGISDAGRQPTTKRGVGCMRRLLARVALRFTILVSGSALLGLGALALASAASADTEVQTSTLFAFAGVNPCTGEAFEGTGNLHLVISSNLSTSGTVQFHLEANVEGLHATTFTGTKYEVPF